MTIDDLLARARRNMADGRAVPARLAFEALLQEDPANIEAHLSLSNIAWMEDRVRDATRHAQDAARYVPADATLIADVAETLLWVGDTAGARTCLQHPFLLQTQDVAVLVRLALVHRLIGEHPESLALLDRARAAGASGVDFHFQRGLELTFNGLLQEAEAEYAVALRSSSTFGRASLAIARLHKQTEQSNHLKAIDERLHSVKAGSEDHVSLEFARYKELEDLGRYDDAWQALARGNALKYAHQRYDAAFSWKLFESLIARCTSDLVREETVHFDGPQPIFIIGMPRSGTTLLDRVLGNHSQVTSVGELDDFGRQLRWVADHRTTLDEPMLQRLPNLDYVEIGRRYLAQTQWRAAPNARFFVDKLPRNWMVAGLIRRALPQARILHLVRAPMDVCFSNYRALLGDAFAYSYDLEALAAHYLQYRAVMAHWHAVMPGQILDVPYADLVREPEAEARKVFAFCGLDWEPGCVDVTRNKSVVATLSMAQVREPIHTRSFEEWRPYEQYLGKLQEAISR